MRCGIQIQGPREEKDDGNIIYQCLLVMNVIRNYLWPGRKVGAGSSSEPIHIDDTEDEAIVVENDEEIHKYIEQSEDFTHEKTPWISIERDEREESVTERTPSEKKKKKKKKNWSNWNSLTHKSPTTNTASHWEGRRNNVDVVDSDDDFLSPDDVARRKSSSDESRKRKLARLRRNSKHDDDDDDDDNVNSDYTDEMEDDVEYIPRSKNLNHGVPRPSLDRAARKKSSQVMLMNETMDLTSDNDCMDENENKWKVEHNGSWGLDYGNISSVYECEHNNGDHHQDNCRVDDDDCLYVEGDSDSSSALNRSSTSIASSIDFSIYHRAYAKAIYFDNQEYFPRKNNCIIDLEQLDDSKELTSEHSRNLLFSVPNDESNGEIVSSFLNDGSSSSFKSKLPVYPLDMGSDVISVRVGEIESQHILAINIKRERIPDLSLNGLRDSFKNRRFFKVPNEESLVIVTNHPCFQLILQWIVWSGCRVEQMKRTVKEDYVKKFKKQKSWISLIDQVIFEDIPDLHDGAAKRNRRRSRKVREEEIGQDPEDAIVVLQYPMEKDAQDVITINRGDIKRLQPMEYLNDNLIDLRIKLIMKDLQAENPKFAARFHIFNSLFYTKLCESDDITVGYENVKRWTKNVDIFEKDFIIIPVNESKHWSLSVIVRPFVAMLENFHELWKTDHVDLPCILYLDSLCIHPKEKIAQKLRGYLSLEWATRKCMSINYERSGVENSIEVNSQNEDVSKLMGTLALYSPENVPIVECSESVPQQKNSYDCGVFVIKYFQMVVNEKPKSSMRCIQNKFSEQFCTTYFTDKDIDIERSLIRDIIRNLQLEYNRLLTERALEAPEQYDEEENSQIFMHDTIAATTNWKGEQEQEQGNGYDDTNMTYNDSNLCDNGSKSVRRRKSALEIIDESIESVNNDHSPNSIRLRFTECNLTESVLLEMQKEDGTLYDKEHYCPICREKFSKMIKVKQHPTGMTRSASTSTWSDYKNIV